MSMLLDGAACYKDCNVSVEFQNRIASWGCIVIVLHKIKQPRKKKNRMKLWNIRNIPLFVVQSLNEE